MGALQGLLALCCSSSVHATTASKGPAAPGGKEAGHKQQKEAGPADPVNTDALTAAQQSGPKPASKGKILNQLAEFEIVVEGNPKATGNFAASAPTFSKLSVLCSNVVTLSPQKLCLAALG